MRAGNTEGALLTAVAREEAGWVLTLAGELELGTVGPLRARLRGLYDRPVVLDLSGLTFMDSTGLAFLLEERACARRRGTPFRIRGAAGQTLEVLERTGLLGLLDDGR